MACSDNCSALMRLIAALLTAAGVYLQIAAAGNCEFVTYTVPGAADTGRIGMLYWQRIGDDSCTEYHLNQSDGNYLKMSRLSIGIAFISAAIGGLLVLIEVVLLSVCCSSFLESSAYVLATTFSGLTYLIFLSAYCNSTVGTCEMGEGAWFNVGAGGAYVLANIILCVTPSPTPIVQRLCCPEKKSSDEVDNVEEQAAAASYADSPSATGSEQGSIYTTNSPSYGIQTQSTTENYAVTGY